MLWLFTQVWVWIIVALVRGVRAGWVFWARPSRRGADALAGGAPADERTPADRTADRTADRAA